MAHEAHETLPYFFYEPLISSLLCITIYFNISITVFKLLLLLRTYWMCKMHIRNNIIFNDIITQLITRSGTNSRIFHWEWCIVSRSDEEQQEGKRGMIFDDQRWTVEKSQMRQFIHSYVLFYFIGSRPSSRPSMMPVRRSGMLRIKRKRQREIEREKRLHAHYCETSYRESYRGEVEGRRRERERRRDNERNAESAMWTQSRSSDQLIDCLHGGYYLGVSSWVGWQKLYWKTPPWEDEFDVGFACGEYQLTNFH